MTLPTPAPQSITRSDPNLCFSYNSFKNFFESAASGAFKFPKPPKTPFTVASVFFCNRIKKMNKYIRQRLISYFSLNKYLPIFSLLRIPIFHGTYRIHNSPLQFCFNSNPINYILFTIQLDFPHFINIFITKSKEKCLA